MKRFISSGSIGQFRQTIRDVQHMSRYQGQDENGEVIFDRGAKLPILTFIGSEKIHGTQASVCYSIPDGIWYQSRKNIITPENDNMGCAFQADINHAQWKGIIHKLADEYEINLEQNIITIFYEWAGGNIQKKSALSGLNKSSIIFQYFKVSPNDKIEDDSDEKAYWLETKFQQFKKLDCPYNWADAKADNIWNIMDFPYQRIDIDFERPDISQNQMIEMVEELEKSSRVGEQFGIDGNIGEGYVFSCMIDGSLMRFKVKGEEHSKGTGKVKTLKPVNEEFENKKITFVNDYACTESRLQQMWTELVHENGEVTVKMTGDFLRKVVNDVIKEESDIIAKEGLEPKIINGMISKVARGFFMTKLDEEAGL